MLAYIATKDRFLRDAPIIGDVVQDAVQTGLGIRIRATSSEYRSWQNSLGNAMYHVLSSPQIPDDAGVAVEYQLRGRRQRIDVLVSGFDAEGVRSLVIVELKQWSEVSVSDLADHITTFIGGASRDERHPSYQAWSYGGLLTGFYQVVSSDPIRIQPCSYVHNCTNASVLRSPELRTLLNRSPVYLKGEHEPLRQLISDRIDKGDTGEAIERVESSAITPSAKLVDTLKKLLRGNEAFVLIDEQKTAFEMIMRSVRSAPVGRHHVLVIGGGPGTGKSVIAVNALVRLLSEGHNARYVTRNAAPRTVYKATLQGKSRRPEIENLFVSSSAFFDAEENALDVLLVDEAHRLTRHSGPFNNLGENQVAELIKAAKVCVFFIDDDQQVAWRDIGSREQIALQSTRFGVDPEMTELTAQFRCAGSDEYLRWVDSVLGISDEPVSSLSGSEYGLRIVDSPSELREIVFEHDHHGESARLLAGYCWPWRSKKDPAAIDIVFPDGLGLQWNLRKTGFEWMITPSSINEVGCVYTSQGLESDYMGIIIGPDLVWRDGQMRVDMSAHSPDDSGLKGWKSGMKNDPERTSKRLDRLIRNTYRTLLTRGMKGTYLYSTDPETQTYLKECASR